MHSFHTTNATIGEPRGQLAVGPRLLLGLAFGLAVASRADAAHAATQERSPIPATPTRRIVVSLADRKLALVDDGRVVATFPVAIGRASTPTPTGTFRILSRLSDPTWYGPKQVVAPGPENPLGTRWIGFSQNGFGIHGTNRPSSIGKAASHGCLRLRRDDVEALFALVRVGDAVEIHAVLDPLAEPDVAAAFLGVAHRGGTQLPWPPRSSRRPGDPRRRA